MYRFLIACDRVQTMRTMQPEEWIEWSVGSNGVKMIVLIASIRRAGMGSTAFGAICMLTRLTVWTRQRWRRHTGRNEDRIYNSLASKDSATVALHGYQARRRKTRDVKKNAIQFQQCPNSKLNPAVLHPINPGRFLDDKTSLSNATIPVYEYCE